MPCAVAAGDAEGANEMTANIKFLRQFCRAFQSRAESTRVFFPDDKVRRHTATGLLPGLSGM